MVVAVLVLVVAVSVDDVHFFSPSVPIKAGSQHGMVVVVVVVAVVVVLVVVA